MRVISKEGILDTFRKPVEGLEIENGIARFPSLALPHGFSTAAMGNMSTRWGAREEVVRNRKFFYEITGLSGDKSAHMVPAEKGCGIYVGQPRWLEDKKSPVRSLEVNDRRDLTKIQCDAFLARNFSVRGIAFAFDFIDFPATISCDAIFTDDGVTLSVCPADSFPIIITNVDKEWGSGMEGAVVALVIAGWRETKCHIVQRAIRALVDKFIIDHTIAGPFLENLLVFIGPGIHPCCYKPNLFARLAGARSDLFDENVRQLLRAGIRPENITIAGMCTCHSREMDGSYRFFSHQRAKTTGEPEARFLAAVGLK